MAKIVVRFQMFLHFVDDDGGGEDARGRKRDLCYWKFCWILVPMYRVIRWRCDLKWAAESQLSKCHFIRETKWKKKWQQKDYPAQCSGCLYLCIFHAVARFECHTLNALEDLWRENLFRLKCLTKSIFFSWPTRREPMNRCIWKMSSAVATAAVAATTSKRT